MGLSCSSGKSVKIFEILTLGPNFFVINSPFLAYSPNPASMAKGMDKAVSF